MQSRLFFLRAQYNPFDRLLLLQAVVTLTVKFKFDEDRTKGYFSAHE